MKRILCLVLLIPSLAYARDTIVVVWDASGSMQTTTPEGMSRMNAAKMALKRVLPQIKEDTDLGILVFSADNLQNEWVYPIGKIVPKKVNTAINLPNPAYGTPLGDYIKKGADKLLDKRMKAGNSGRFRLIIVTDGESNEGHDPESWLLDVKKKGIETTLIGLGMDADHSLAQIIRQAPTPGVYQSASDAKALTEVMTKATAEAPMVKGTIDPILFEEISPIPANMAQTMIGGISQYNNTPIGDPDPIIVLTSDVGHVKASSINSKILLAIAVLGVIVIGVIIFKSM